MHTLLLLLAITAQAPVPARDIQVPIVINHPPQPESLVRDTPEDRIERERLAFIQRLAREQAITAETISAMRLQAERASRAAGRDAAQLDLLKNFGRDQLLRDAAAIDAGTRALIGQQQATAARSASAHAEFSQSAAADARIGEAFARGVTSILKETTKQIGEVQKEAVRAGAAVAGGSMGMPTGARGTPVPKVHPSSGGESAVSTGPRFDPNNPQAFEAYLDALAGRGPAMYTPALRRDAVTGGGALGEGRPNGSRAEAVLGAVGKYGCTAGVAYLASGLATPVGQAAVAAVGVMAADACERVGEATGRAVDRYAERLNKD